jgi:hypothetical protein
MQVSDTDVEASEGIRVVNMGNRRLALTVNPILWAVPLASSFYSKLDWLSALIEPVLKIEVQPDSTTFQGFCNKREQGTGIKLTFLPPVLTPDLISPRLAVPPVSLLTSIKRNDFDII